jgi:hypothetical protein
VNTKESCAEHIDHIDAQEASGIVKVIDDILGLIQTPHHNSGRLSTRISIYVRTALVVIEGMHATPSANLALEIIYRSF